MHSGWCGAGVPLRQAVPVAVVPAPSPDPARGTTPGRLERAAPVALGLVVACLAGFRAGPLSDYDGWWHLRTGEYILDRSVIPRRDPFSWTALGDRWHPNGWAADPVFEAVRRVGGLAGVSVLRAGLFAVTLLAIGALARRRGARPWPIVAAVVVAGLALIPFVNERPQLFSYLLLPVAVALAGPALSGSNRALAGLAATFVLWANLHGVAPLGVAVVGAMAAGHAVASRRAGRPVVVVAVAALAVLATPYGVLTYTDAPVVRGLGRDLAIGEYRHPDLAQGADLMATIVAVLAVVSLIRTGRWRRLDVVLPLALLAVATVDAIRSAPMFVVLAGPELALGFATIGSARLRARTGPRAGPLAAGGAVVLAAALVGAVDTAGKAGHVDRSRFPAGAVAAIPDGCRVLNEYEQGGYLLFARWPGVKVSQDSRADVYGTAPLLEQRRFLQGGSGAEKWLRENGVDCVLAEPDRPLLDQLRATPDWREVVAEPAGVLLVRRHRSAGTAVDHP